MYSYGEASLRNLQTCHPDIQALLNEAIKYIDISVICGERGCIKQMEYFHATPRPLSLKVYPDSKHNPDFESFNSEELAAILNCSPSKESIKEAMKIAQRHQLQKIDEIAPRQGSRAVDIVPWKPNKPHINWDWEKELFRTITENSRNPDIPEIKSKLYNIEEWIYFHGRIKGIADNMGIPIRSGYDWNGDGQRGDQDFDDMPHIELI